MAYALFNSGAAAAYANNFRQRSPYGGFEQVKSTIGQETLAKTPFINFKAQVDMAQAALKEAGATKRQEMVNDASIEVNKMRYGKSGDGSTAKKQALARLMSGSGSTAQRGGGTSPYLQAIAQGGSPLDRAISFTNRDAQLSSDAYARFAQAEKAAVSGIQNIPTSVNSGGSSTPPPQSPAPTQQQTGKPPSVNSDVKVDDLIQEIWDSRNGGTAE